jgi:hypothetical protein
MVGKKILLGCSKWPKKAGLEAARQNYKSALGLD